MRRFRIFGFAAIAVLAIAALSCEQSAAPYIRHHGTTQGTYYIVTYESPDSISYEEDIKRILDDFSASLSTYIPTSLISRINRNDATVVVDEYFRTVFNKAVELSAASEGAFDITVAPLVNLWGFGFTSDYPDVDPQKIDSLLQYIGIDKIRIEGDRVVKDLPGVMLNMNAIAKGYSADMVVDLLKSKGCSNLMEIGRAHV